MSFLSRLSTLQRFSMERLSNRESVLEHLGQVTLTAYLLASEVSKRDPSVKISVEEVLKRAIVHDVEEVITGDVPRPVKHASSESREMFATLTQRSMRKIVGSLRKFFPAFAVSMEMSHFAAKGEGVCGLVVALADVLAVVTKVWEETILRGNGAMIRQAHTARRQLIGMQVRLDRELDQYSEAREFLEGVILDALQVTTEAASRDSPWLGTEVERY